MVSSLSSGITIRRGRPEPSRERRWSGAHRRVGVAREGPAAREECRHLEAPPDAVTLHESVKSEMTLTYSLTTTHTRHA